MSYGGPKTVGNRQNTCAKKKGKKRQKVLFQARLPAAVSENEPVLFPMKTGAIELWGLNLM